MAFMNFQEWREFSRDITAGIFGGLVVALWQLSYEILSNKSTLTRILFPLAITFVFFILMILFLRWLFLKKEDITNTDITSKIAKKQKKDYAEKNLFLWKEVGKDEYLARRGEWTSTDNKLVSLLIIILAIIGLFVQYIDTKNLVASQQYFYAGAIILFLMSLIFCILGLFPDKLNTINFEYNKNNSYRKELRVLRNQYKKAIENQDTKINKKLFLFKVSAISFLIGIFFILLIKLGVTF